MKSFRPASDHERLKRRSLMKKLVLSIIAAGISGVSICVAQAQTPTCTPPPAGMVGWWPGDGSADDILNHNNGASSGNVTFVAGEVGQAFNFDGSSFETIGTPAVLNITGNQITLDAWVNPNNTKDGVYFGKANSGQNDYALFLLGDLTGCIKTADGVEYFLHTGFVPPAGQWTHIAMTYDGTNEIVYANGAVVGTLAVASQPSYTPPGNIISEGIPFFIGGRNGDSPANTLYINAKIDEVEVFNTALSQPDIQAIYDARSAGKCRSCTPPPPDMVSWWPGDGNTTDIQSGNNGTLQGGATFATGEVGQAFSLNGTNQYVEIPDSANVSITGPMTIDAWINTNDNANEHAIVEKYDGGGTNGYFFRLNSGGHLGAGMCNASTCSAVVGATQVTTGTFHHVAAVFDGTNLRVYLDGVLDGTASSVSPTDGVNPLEIGARGGSPFNFFTGLIDEVEVFSRALTADEVQFIYDAGSKGKCKPVCVTPPPGLIAWWPGDNTATDIQGNNNGTLQNGATFANGIVGRAFSFDGVDDYVDVGDVDLPGTFTIDAWINPSSLGNKIIISKDDLNASRSYFFGLETGTLSAFVHSSGGQYTYYRTDSIITANNWQHVVVTYDGSAGAGVKMTFYVNGVNVPILQVVDDGGGTPENNAFSTRIGIFGDGTGAFSGLIDEVEVFTRVLAPTEIANIYNARSAGKCKTVRFYVSNSSVSGSGTIEEFDANGADLGTFADASSGLIFPSGLAFDASGNLFVGDFGANNIRKFDSHGSATVFANSSTGLSGPVGLAFDSSGNIYVADVNVNKIFKFLPDGSGSGTTSSNLSGPGDIAIGPDGLLYVANESNNTVQKFDSALTYQGQFPSTGLQSPTGLRFDSSGQLYVSNFVGDTIKKFDSAGNSLGNFANLNDGSGFYGLTFDPDGNLYVVVSASKNIIYKFDPNANTTTFASAPSANLNQPEHIAVRELSPTASTLQFTTPTYSVSETAGQVSITVTRAGDLSVAASVHYATSDGTSTAGLDYTSTSGDLSFAPGDSSKTIQVPILDDNVHGPNGTFIVTLSSPSFAILDLATTTVTIQEVTDNDGVTNTNDNGPGSLRQAIADALAGDTINFNLGAGPHTITLTTGELLIDKNVTINGSGADVLTVSGTNSFRIFHIISGPTVTISGLTITNGSAIDASPADSGGGIYNDHSTLTVTNCTLSGNTANTDGGGIFSDGSNGSATLTIANSTLTFNSANYGGGIYNKKGFGGSATLTIRNSTLSDNAAGGGYGGGIYNDGAFSGGAAVLTIANSTFSGNSATSGAGGIFSDASNSGSAQLVITNSTFSQNSASQGGGIYSISTGATLQIGNTILNAGSSGENILGDPGTVTSQGYNLSSDNGSGFLTATGDQINTDPKLKALGNYGGPTQTHLPLPDSPAIDAAADWTTLNGTIDNAQPTITVTDASAISVGETIRIDNEQMGVTAKSGNTLTVTRGANSTTPATHASGAGVNSAFDQRGLPRKVNGTVDIGAVETNYVFSATAGTPQSAKTNTAFATALQATVTESGTAQSGISVTFTAPSSGASGTFPGASNTVSVSTNGSGIATAPTFTANATTGNYTVTAGTANNIVSPANFALTNVQAPAFTSANSTTFTVGTNGSFNVTTSGFPTPALSKTGSLPSGVTFTDNGDGTATLAGTPAAGSGGSYSLTITASNGVSPDAMQTFTLTVDEPPRISSVNNATFSVGALGSFNVTTDRGFPTPALSTTGTLPSGVTFTDNGNGTATIAGTPAVGSGGSYPLTIKASNGILPDATQNFTLTVDEPPRISSVNNATFSVGALGSFNVTTDRGFPTPALSKTGTLPSGVTFTDNGNGTATIAGTPAVGSGGSYPLTIKASNGILPDAIQNFTLTVNEPPRISSVNNATFSVGEFGSFSVTTDRGFPTPALSKTGNLPSGVTFTNNGNGTATIAGTPAAGTGGTYSLTITASNGVSPDAIQSFTLTVNDQPRISSANKATFIVGALGSFSVTTDRGFPTPALSKTGSLPTGVTFTDNGNGTATIAGTPAAGTGGTYSLTITASNGVPADATQLFKLTVNEPPRISSVNNATFSVGAAGNFSVTTDRGFPTPIFLSKTGTLPSGVTFTDNLNGTATIAGTPAAGSGGSYPLTIKASNGVSPDATQSFTLTVNEPPRINSASSVTFTAGTAGTFAVTTDRGFPTPALSKIGSLPSGVTFTDNGNGTATLGGTAAKGSGGSYPITITASNGVSPNATQKFVLTVLDTEPPHISSANNTTFTVGSAGTFTVSTDHGVPTPTLSETGALPGGVTFTNNGNGTATIAGTAAAGTGGVYTLAITASNGIAPNDVQTFTLSVKEVPTITSADHTTFATGSAGSFTVTTSHSFPTATLSETGSLPSGVTFIDNGNGTAKLAGTPAAGTAGTYYLTIMAHNGVGLDPQQLFTLTVTGSAPTPTPTPSPTPSKAQALNLSTRLRVDTGEKVMIGGFIITGNTFKQVVLRGLGPSLTAFGLTDVLQNPVLELRRANGSLIISNDDWTDNQRSQIEGTVFQPKDDRESVIIASLQPGAYTAILTGKDGTAGVGLVEIYDTNSQSNDSQLANISTRGFVQTQGNVMIAGFTLGGNTNSTRVAILGLGPSLTQFGLVNVLADPTLELHDSNGALMISNDNWQDDPVAAAQLVTAGLAPQNPKEAGIFTTLPPGPYTAILAGKNGGMGIGLVEAFNLQ